MKLYPTIHNKRDPYGLAAYKFRGQRVYPTANNKWDTYGLAAYKVRAV